MTTAVVSEWGTANRAPRRSYDDYPTPPSFTDALCRLESFTGEVWEPAAGSGHMVRALQASGLTVRDTDLRLGSRPLDFLSDHGRRAANIVTNPPYKYALEFALKALQSADQKVALLVKASFLEGASRHSQLFSVYPPARVWMTTRRMYLGGDRGTGGGGSFAHCWVVWDRSRRGDTSLGWFTPEGSLLIPED